MTYYVMCTLYNTVIHFYFCTIHYNDIRLNEPYYKIIHVYVNCEVGKLLTVVGISVNSCRSVSK